MVNEFVLDDLSSSWTSSIYQNKSNSKCMQEVAPTLYTYIFVYIYNKVAPQSPLTALPLLGINLSRWCEGECKDRRRNIWLLVKCCASTFSIQCSLEFALREFFREESCAWTRVRVGGANFDLESNVAPTPVYVHCMYYGEPCLSFFKPQFELAPH